MISNALLLVSTMSSVGVDNGQSITPPMYVSDLLCPACFFYLYSFSFLNLELMPMPLKNIEGSTLWECSSQLYTAELCSTAVSIFLQ